MSSQKKALKQKTSQQKGKFINLPLDIHISISDFLPAESYLAISLTCKPAYSTFYADAKGKLDADGASKWNQLMEKTWTNGTYHCHQCGKPHKFSPLWGPCHQRSNLRGPPCSARSQSWSLLDLQFHHAKLAMNAHLWGPTHGLHLKRLELAVVRSRFLGWETRHQARIYQNELYLKVTHTLHCCDVNTRQGVGLMTASHDHFLCPHTTTHDIGEAAVAANPSIRQIPYLVASGKNIIRHHKEEDCCGKRDHCPHCLTDFTTTYKRVAIEGGIVAGFAFGVKYMSQGHVKIVSYHQLGACRSPSDWKWLGFSSGERTAEAMPRGTGQFAPGKIMERWKAGKKTKWQEAKDYRRNVKAWGASTLRSFKCGGLDYDAPTDPRHPTATILNMRLDEAGDA